MCDYDYNWNEPTSLLPWSSLSVLQDNMSQWMNTGLVNNNKLRSYQCVKLSQCQKTKPIYEEYRLVCLSVCLCIEHCVWLLQAARLQTEGVAVSSVLLSPLVDGSVAVCLATCSTKMASTALPPVRHTAKRIAKMDRTRQIDLCICTYT